MREPAQDEAFLMHSWLPRRFRWLPEGDRASIFGVYATALAGGAGAFMDPEASGRLMMSALVPGSIMLDAYPETEGPALAWTYDKAKVRFDPRDAADLGAVLQLIHFEVSTDPDARLTSWVFPCTGDPITAARVLALRLTRSLDEDAQAGAAQHFKRHSALLRCRTEDDILCDLIATARGPFIDRGPAAPPREDRDAL